MRIEIDESLCAGHAMCVLAAPDLVDVDLDDGHAFVVQSEVPADQAAAARMARSGCPEGAVRLVDDTS